MGYKLSINKCLHGEQLACVCIPCGRLIGTSSLGPYDKRFMSEAKMVESQGTQVQEVVKLIKTLTVQQRLSILSALESSFYRYCGTEYCTCKPAE